ncbi:MAG: hypothetical protein ACRD7E_30650 [Bryobacteraceae bacterium]
MSKLLSSINRFIAVTACAAILVPGSLVAGEHVVPTAELHKQIMSASDARKSNLDQVRRVLGSEPARKALEAVKVDGAQLQKSVALLSDEELANLSARSQQIERDIAGGALNNQEITYILIALVTAVVILVIVVA